MKSGSAGDAVPQNVAMFPRRQERRQNYEEAFLPAALEIVETPPSPTGRAIGVTIIAVFCCAIGWATFGHVDILSSASGKVVPTGQVKLIQPFETGVIRAIDVRDGQRVKAGELLIELDPTMSAAEEQHIRNDLVAAELDIARLEAVLSDTLNPGTDFRPPEGAGPQLVATQLRLANNQVKEYQAKLASLDAQRAEKQADRDAVSATIDKLLASQTLIQQRVDILQYLSDKGLTSKLTYLKTLQLPLRTRRSSRFRKIEWKRPKQELRLLSKPEPGRLRNSIAPRFRISRRRNGKQVAWRVIWLRRSGRRNCSCWPLPLTALCSSSRYIQWAVW